MIILKCTLQQKFEISKISRHVMIILNGMGQSVMQSDRYECSVDE